MPIHSAYPAVDIPPVSLFQYLFADLAPQHADKLAIADSGTSATYSELRDMIERFAGALAARGIGKGDVVALHCPNSTTFAVAFHGILRANATVTTVASMATADDVEKQLRLSGAKAILTTSAIGWAGHQGGENAGLSDDKIIGLTGIHGIAEMLLEGSPVPEEDIDSEHDVAVIPFSSGTTGVPKGVQLTHQNLVANLVQMGSIIGGHIDENTIAVTPLPFFHIYGMNVLLNLLLAVRASQYAMAKFDLLEFLELVQTHKANFAFIAPPIAVGLAKHPGVDAYDLSSLTKILSGAASLQADLASLVERRIGCEITQGFGMTELSPVSHVRLDQSTPVDSIGLAIPNTSYKLVDVSDPALTEIQPPASGRSEAGELWIHGPQVMLGYLNNPEANSIILVDGWLRTGDIAEMDADGNVYIVDRLKELIKYKGYQVAPAELEDILLQHPDIADAACVGVVDRAGDEIPKAFVVKREGANVSEDDIIDFVAERVAAYKKVREVEFIAEVPKSATGKILRKNLKQL
ncbi:MULTISPECIES: AMP-binding protein [unclassified Corynebacterium]|uniref:AMP-binding protein n=1 Tax=unclassified Corynebacterium TaxID=2624378 RepID=UPI00309F81ED